MRKINAMLPPFVADMQPYSKLLLIFICLFMSQISEADTSGMIYQPVGQISSTQLPLGQWQGLVSFQKIYCATFPKSTLAQRVDQALFNNRTVSWISVSYVDNTIASIAISTIPENQSPEDAIKKILQNEKNNEDVLSKEGVDYKVEEDKTAWGNSIIVKATNLVPTSSHGPFPLTRIVRIPTNPATPITSKSVHRLFVKGHDRYEIAIMRTPIFDVNDTQKKAGDVELMSMLDQLFIDLQFCTSQMQSNNFSPLGR